MRAIRPPAILPLLLTGALATSACASERAVRVALEVEDDAAGDVVCLIAHGAGEVVFAEPYPLATLPPGERSLTFVAGERVDESVRVTARIAREGRIAARASTELRFAEQGSVVGTVRPQRCAMRGPVGLGARPGGRFAALAPSARMMAADLDGDGRDELLALGADGALLALDAEQRNAGSRRATELRAPEGRLVATGDLDDDCALEVVAATPVGALVVLGATGASPRSLGSAARDVALGLRSEGGARALAIASEEGLFITPWDDDAGRLLATGAFTQVATGDLTGDGDDDLVAVGGSGTSVWLATESGLREEPAALPASLTTSQGLVVLGDVDGDGDVDLVTALGATLRVALNRGDGLLEDRSGTAPPSLEAAPLRLATGDLDGDCAEEIVALGPNGRANVWSRDARAAWVARIDVPEIEAVDLEMVDADGDGALELAMLDATGGVTLWRP